MEIPSEDIDEETDQVYDVLDATIFLIDASASMFTTHQSNEEGSQETSEDGDSPFVSALRCAYDTLCSKIFTAPSDPVGVVLFGTKKPNNLDEKYGMYSNAHVLQDLKKADCDPIKQLELMIKEGHFQEYKSLACSPQTFSIADSLWLCSSMFTKHKSKKINKQIFLFTNNDEPHSKFSDKHKQAERRVGDLLDSNVGLFLFPIGECFDIKKVYQELFTDEGSILSGSMNSEELLSKICRKRQKKRIVATLVFNLEPNLKFGVKVYNLARAVPLPKHIHMDKRTNEPVKPILTKFNAETAEILLSSEVTNFITVSDKKIQLNKTDLATLKSKFQPGFTLLGFKPIEKLKLHLHLSPGSFIYPDEESIKGSRSLFGALLDRCKKSNIAPLCSFKATALNKPRIVALFPQIDDQVDHPMFGFHVIFLPYRNDIRKLSYDSLVGSTVTLADAGTRAVPEIWRADQDQVDAAKMIVKKLTMKSGYTPKVFENPALHTRWKMLKGLALGNGDIEPVEDVTMPDVESIERRLGDRSATFNSLVFPMDYQSPFKTTTKFSGTDNDIMVEEAARNGRLPKLTVEHLKGYLSGKGVRGFSGKKKLELISMVETEMELK